MALSDFALTDEESSALETEATEIGLTAALRHECHVHAIKSISDRPDLVPDDMDPTVMFADLAQRLSVAWPFEEEVLEVATKTVCFTGDQTRDGVFVDREEATRIANSYGWTVTEQFTKRDCTLLIAGDVETQSKKASNARRWGIPVMSWDEFLNSESR